ncbi:MAG: hypothetical protein Q7U84_08820, partial [Polynucleobacter sp.]|nr:hypothetical protein [Polynucleobacter sp.]
MRSVVPNLLSWLLPESNSASTSSVQLASPRVDCGDAACSAESAAPPVATVGSVQDAPETRGTSNLSSAIKGTLHTEEFVKSAEKEFNRVLEEHASNKHSKLLNKASFTLVYLILKKKVAGLTKEAILGDAEVREFACNNATCWNGKSPLDGAYQWIARHKFMIDERTINAPIESVVITAEHREGRAKGRHAKLGKGAGAENSDPSYDHVVRRVRVVRTDELYQLLSAAHRTINYESRLYEHCQELYFPLDREICALFQKMSAVKSMSVAKTEREKPQISHIIKERIFNRRCQVDLLKMPNQDVKDPASNSVLTYRYVCTYKDHASRFTVAAPLVTKTAAEVAKRLQEFWMILGPPQILQSDNGGEFIAKLIEELCSMWSPGIILINGSPKHPQSQGSVESANASFRKCMAKHGIATGSSNWVEALPMVVHQFNLSESRAIRASPYE